MRRRRLLPGLAAASLVGALSFSGGSATGATVADTGITGKTRGITPLGTIPFASGQAGVVGAPVLHELPTELGEGDVGGGSGAAAAASSRSGQVVAVNRHVPGRQLPGAAAVASALTVSGPGTAPASTTAVPATAASASPSSAKLLRSFAGLDHADSRTADGGKQFSGEPPDQALCAGKGVVLEGVNSAIQLYQPNGTALGVSSLNRFFGLPSAIDRSVPTFGPFVFDVTCVFDPATGAFFVVADDLAQDPDTGDFTGETFLDIAVTTNPTGSWNVFRLDVTDDGTAGTPTHAGCPCFADYPHIGLDSNGFYITANEFPLFADGFDSAQVYAFRKADLIHNVSGALVTQFDTTGADQGNGGFTVWPAQSPASKDYELDHGGTEYFLSSNAVFGDIVSSNTLVTWAMTDTSTLGTAHPSAVLRDVRVPVKTYTLPPAVPQRGGAAPLRDCLNSADCASVLGLPAAVPAEVLADLDSNDTRIQQVVYTGGKLYSSLDTAVAVGGGTQAGIAWYVLAPESSRRRVDAKVKKQGQFGVAGNGVTYPAVGVTSQGKGVIAFTLAGPGFYPSAAYATLSADGVGPLKIAAAGVGPADGFSDYSSFSDPPRPRWGDYGAAAAVGDDVWIASEYVGQACSLADYTTAPFGSCGGTRTALANWGTRITAVRP